MLPRVGVGVGLGVIVVGTFLPWLKSGRATRNSYASDGAVRRLLDLNGALDAVLRGWPFVSLLCAVAIGLVLLGAHRLGLGIAALAALGAGAVAGWALAATGNLLIRPAVTGPAVTLGGAILTGICVILCARRSSALSRRTPR